MLKTQKSMKRTSVAVKNEENVLDDNYGTGGREARFMGFLEITGGEKKLKKKKTKKALTDDVDSKPNNQPTVLEKMITATGLKKFESKKAQPEDDFHDLDIGADSEHESSDYEKNPEKMQNLKDLMNDDFFIRYEIDPQEMEPVNDSESSNSETLLERFQPKKGFDTAADEYKFFAIGKDTLATDHSANAPKDSEVHLDDIAEEALNLEDEQGPHKIDFGDVKEYDVQSDGSNVESIKSSSSDPEFDDQWRTSNELEFWKGRIK